ncbi:MAG TPA: hypothetical protein VN725_07815 [Rhodanobacteraceae bacterium]|nr:hypothetical protein [Rhodanobacteraceae bacterium]
MNRLILTSALIAACGLGGFATSAAAQTTNTAPAGAAATAQARADATDVALGTRQVPAPGARDCIQDTGSHIKRRDQACLPLNGNSYTREDLRRTGNPNIGEALQQLDPAVQISHGHHHR